MHILIDDQKPIEVTSITDLTNQDDEPVTVLAFTEAHKILTAWKDLDLRRRDFTYGDDESDTEPSTVIIAYAVADRLEFHSIDPFWDGSMEYNAYDLADLSAVLPLKVVD